MIDKLGTLPAVLRTLLMLAVLGLAVLIGQTVLENIKQNIT